MTVKYLIQKEFLQILRNPFLPRLIFIFPIMIYVRDALGDEHGNQEYRGRYS